MKGQKTTPVLDDSSDEESNVELSRMDDGEVHWAATLSWLFCAVPSLLCSFTVVEQNTELVTLHCGRFSNVYKQPGCFFINPCGVEKIVVSKAKISIDLPNTKVIDFNGNPLIVSGVVVYYWADTKKAALDIASRECFVADQASAVMKSIVSQYPYEHLDDKSGSEDSDSEAIDERPCLKTEAKQITDRLVRNLQRRVKIAGAKVDSFRFNEISYAPEIAQGMLKKQQAEAVVQSRSTLVRGAVSIATSTMSRLSKRKIVMDHVEKTRLVSNLLTVVCADEKVHPMIQLG
eukprot:TRINITY_DN1141_c0_g1_i1.p1 TRINITY_DN1141_c0_g1~~TRINITY_DN1141_c0_g1_i1.p1  ORF type:complete len:290 (-),score=50.55 TRINITY_DN1141_c0_g1_i1:57-926(-)